MNKPARKPANFLLDLAFILHVVILPASLSLQKLKIHLYMFHIETISTLSFIEILQ
jgi:hypothetical protein